VKNDVHRNPSVHFIFTHTNNKIASIHYAFDCHGTQKTYVTPYAIARNQQNDHTRVGFNWPAALFTAVHRF
jgi:hypothetical protein